MTDRRKGRRIPYVETTAFLYSLHGICRRLTSVSSTTVVCCKAGISPSTAATPLRPTDPSGRSNAQLIHLTVYLTSDLQTDASDSLGLGIQQPGSGCRETGPGWPSSVLQAA